MENMDFQFVTEDRSEYIRLHSPLMCPLSKYFTYYTYIFQGPQYVNQNQRDPAGPGVSGTTGKEEDYLYAEKGLTHAFRSYLKERKVDD